MPQDLSQNSRRLAEHRLVVSDWFKQFGLPDEVSLECWQGQYELAKANKEHKLPEDRLRMLSNDLSVTKIRGQPVNQAVHSSVRVSANATAEMDRPYSR